MNNQSFRYIFILGREREIALEELKAVLHRFGFCFDITSVSGNLALINIDNAKESDVAGLTSVLGGTVKVFKLISSVIPTGAASRAEESLSVSPPRLGGARGGSMKDTIQLPHLTSPNLVEEIRDLVTTRRRGKDTKFNFGISDYTGKINARRVNNIGIEVKKALKGELKTRFVALRDGNELSSIVSLKNDLDGEGIEIGIFSLPQYCSSEARTNTDFSLQEHRSKNNVVLGTLIGLSNPEEWSKRDYGKPAGDRFSGMVPPKLARMMVNIALRQAGKTASKQDSKYESDPNQKANMLTSLPAYQLVFDPFCGSGNILMEAMLLGSDVIGSDISEKAVRDTRANLEWLEKNQETPLRQGSEGQARIKNLGKVISITQVDATKPDSLRALLDCHSEQSEAMPAGRQESRRSSMRADKSALDPLAAPQDDNCSIAIVTEPFLGNPKKFKPTLNAARGEYAKIKQLYLNFLRNIANFQNSSSSDGALKSRSSEFSTSSNNIALTIVFPLVETLDGKRYSLYQNSVDEIQELGYTEVRPPLIYGREYQVVKREIVFLELKSQK